MFAYRYTNIFSFAPSLLVLIEGGGWQDEQIEELLSRPAYTDDMRHTIRQRIREGAPLLTSPPPSSLVESLCLTCAPVPHHFFPNAGRFRPEWAAEVNAEEEEAVEEGAEETEAHRGKRGFGFRGTARAAESHHNVERALSGQLVNATILNYIMVANRTVQLHEDMINKALGNASHPTPSLAAVVTFVPDTLTYSQRP